MEIQEMGVVLPVIPSHGSSHHVGIQRWKPIGNQGHEIQLNARFVLRLNSVMKYSISEGRGHSKNLSIQGIV